jgi:hypothetical protein
MNPENERAKRTRRRGAEDTRENGFERFLCAYGCHDVVAGACMDAFVHTLTLWQCKVVRGRGSIPQLFGVAVTLLCFFSYTCGRRGAVKPDSNQSPKGSDWNVSRRFPDYAERPHAVLSREGGPQDLGLGDRP